MAASRDIISLALSERLSEGAAVALASTPEFDEADLRFTQYGRPTYMLAVVPVCEQDVVETLKLAHEYGIPFAARSGHHCVTTSMQHLQDGILIDMRQFKSISLNTRQRCDAECPPSDAAKTDTSVTVGGGVITDDFAKFLTDKGLEVTVGSCPTTGLIGVAFGAGLGRLQGKYGYLHDNLISCRLVLADGSVVNVSKDSHPDLFWAIRGAGHNFGIALEATFRVYPQPHGGLHHSWDLEFPLEKCEELIEVINRVHAIMPPDLAIFLLWKRESAGGQKHLILVNLVWSGAEADAVPWVEEFERLGPVFNPGKVTTDWASLPWETYGGQNKLLSVPGVWKFRPWKMMSAVSVKELCPKTTRYFFERTRDLNEEWEGKGVFGAMFECLPTHRTRELADDATAFPWRNGSDHFLMMTATPLSLDDRSEFEAHLDEWKKKFVEVSGYGRLHQYVNYGSTTTTCQDPPEALYGYEPWRLAKLRALKDLYDPQNAFRFYQPFV